MERPDSPRMSPVDRVTDVVESVKAYAVQETVGPARGAARWLAYGTLAALFMGTGVVLLGLAALRLSQDAGGPSSTAHGPSCTTSLLPSCCP